jgi:RES domain-containing protein
MLLYRISKSIYADDLAGTGAGLYGGRWNPKGLNMVYTAGSVALASLEYMAHNFHLMNVQDITLTIIRTAEDSPIREPDSSEIPRNWNLKFKSSQYTQRIGARFLKQSEDYILKVPSVIVPMEYNYLLNPRHPLHRQTRVVDFITHFQLDERVFGV